MKVPPKRKGNFGRCRVQAPDRRSLNESPSEKEGKSIEQLEEAVEILPLNESPSEKEGKWRFEIAGFPTPGPSMKVPPKRKGNLMHTKGAPPPSRGPQ